VDLFRARAQQFPHRQIARFAFQIPQRDVDAGLCGHDRLTLRGAEPHAGGVAVLVDFCAVVGEREYLRPDRLVRVRIHADQQMAELLDGFQHRLGRAAVYGAQPGQAVIGDDLDDDLGGDGEWLGRNRVFILQRHRQRVPFDGFYFHEAAISGTMRLEAVSKTICSRR
jgi:hypothetical protein